MMHASHGLVEQRNKKGSSPAQGPHATLPDFSAAWGSHLLAAAVKLGLPDQVGDAPVRVTELAATLGVNVPYLQRLTRALVANDCFVQVDGDAVAHSDVSRALRKGSATGLRNMLMLQEEPFMQRAWACLAQGVASGKSPFELAHGESLYAYLGSHPEAAAVFNEAMVAFTTEHAADVIKGYPALQQATNILDLAGGFGHFLIDLLHAAPAARGAVLDLQHAQKGAQARLEAAGLQDRGQFMVGDFLQEVPKEFDLYMIKNALFNWPDEDVVQVMKNISRVLEPQKRFLIIESLLMSDNARWATLMDIQMLVAPQGRCRTVDEYRTLLTKAGLRVERVYDFGSIQGIASVIDRAM